MAFCMFCGAQLQEGAASCRNCGAPAGAVPPAQGNSQQGNYQQGGYQQGGYQQGNYQQGGYQQGNYQQGGYQQGNYQQGGYQQTNQQGTYAGNSGDENPKKKGGFFMKLVFGVLMVIFVIRLLVPVGDFIFGMVLDKKDSADEIKTLSSELPTVNTRTPDRGVIIQWGGVMAGIPYDYIAAKSSDEYVLTNPEYPKKIDMMRLRHDGSYKEEDESKTLERYKDEYSKVVTVATKKMKDYRLYYIVGKKKVEEKSCDAACFLILKENELYSVDIVSDLKESKLGMAGDYLAFDPSVSFGD